MNDNYSRIARVIDYLDNNFKTQPDLAEIADKMNLSPSYLHTVFTNWAGISPKRFLQFLTVEYAKELLNEANTVLDTSYESGLSGPGRLHDLFVSIESMTPGEYKEKGSGLNIQYGIHDTQFGKALIAVTAKGICHLSFHDEDCSEGIERLKNDWYESKLSENNQNTGSFADQIFRGHNSHSATRLNLLVKGTNFQLKVWQALLRIPEGKLTSYSEIAKIINQPGAERAVGNAVALNRIAYLIPCHRVIKKMGVFGNYHWGKTRKKAMIAWESAKYAS